MALNIVFEVISPTMALALTNGPTQPEMLGFEPANTTEMVDLFTGDFKYNIPLMDVDGYPLNLSYHAGQNMESEASWVGLGWSLNPGVLNRMVKGLPDDFNGETVTSKTHIKPHAMMGVGFMKSKWFGANVDFDIVGVGAQIGGNGAVVLSYNNYKGYGLEVEIDAHASTTRNLGPVSFNNSVGVGMSLSSQDGGTLSYNYSQGVGVSIGMPQLSVNLSASMGQGRSINTRTGAETKSSFSSASIGIGASGVNVSVSGTRSQSIPVGSVSYSPRISNNFSGYGFGVQLKAGFWGRARIALPPVNLTLEGGLLLGFKGFYNLSKLSTPIKTQNAYGYLYAENADNSSLMDFNRFRDGVMMEQTPNISFSNQTYDIFSAVGQGMGNNFRAFRSDVGTVHDGDGQVTALNKNAGTELGAFLILHFLLDFTNTNSYTYSGEWNSLINNSLKFDNKDILDAADRFYEKYYFKQMGEISERDNSFNAALGGENAVSPVLVAFGDEYAAASTISGSSRSKRDIRNNYIKSLTAAEASKFGFEKTINLYDKNDLIVDPNTRAVAISSVSANTNIDRKLKTIVNPTVTASIDHHLSEMSLTNNAGSKYVYGIPVYNLAKKRVMFNASSRTEVPYGGGYPNTSTSSNPLLKSEAYQLIAYDDDPAGTDLNENVRGTDNYYQSDSTPAYSTAFLLTSILSPDYVDVTGDGPSYDDLGNYTKFNYYKNNDYGWREPYCYPGSGSVPNKPSDWVASEGSIASTTAQANFIPGFVSDKLDDKAFYEYGIRENYYSHSIETKNYVALFECSDRFDGGSVTDEHGTNLSGNSSLKLDKIKLYSKSEILAKGGVTNAIPIKVVNFEYNYSLCPGTFNSIYDATDNQQRGKLTLKKVSFSYGTSEKSALSPYEFTYDNNFNFAYNPRSVDRWGSYRPNNVTAVTGATISTLNNVEHPYATQNKGFADKYAAAWNLTEIKTPSGSKIKVSYESDDYAYVQNEQAGQMLRIKNMVGSLSPSDDVLNISSNGNIKESEYMIIDMDSLHQGIPIGTYSTQAKADNFARKNLIKLGKQLYYHCMLKMGGPANSFGLKENYYEFVSGYAKPLEVGVFTNTGIPGNLFTDATGATCYRFAYVRLQKEIGFDSKEVNPITYAGWDFMRNFLPRIAYPGSEPANMGDGNHKPLKQLQNAIVGIGVALADFVNGVTGDPNKRFYNKNFCNAMVYDKSFVRAYIPYKKKFGGGYRVNKIIMNDSWNDMTGTQEPATTYGQTYEYTTKEGTNTISSGVALYEPILGGDENTLRQPIEFEIPKKFAPNDNLYQETPYAEMLYPAPLVGYSKVTVTTLPDPGADTPPDVCRIGRVEYEFHTAKDFPIIYQTSGLSKSLAENDLIENFVTVELAYKILHAAQGFTVKFNDMHGKPKAINTFAENTQQPNNPISGIKYIYKQTASGSNGSAQLITTAPTINEFNQIGNSVMSKDIDVTVDTGENISENITSGTSFLLEISIDLSTTSLIIGVNINAGTVNGHQKIGSRYATITKVVQQYGILQKVETFDNTSKTTTENLLWDKNTGDVVLTKVTNNLDQAVYNFNYPAYWIYPQMGHEFKRDGIEILCPAYNATTNPNPIITTSTGIISTTAVTTPTLLLAEGDQVIVMKNDPTRTQIGDRFWVMIDHGNSPFTNHYLLDENGLKLTTGNYPALNVANDHIIKIIKPINKNNLVASAGQVTSRFTSTVTPALASIIDYTNTSQNIIDAKVQEFCTSPSFYIQPAAGDHTLTNVAPSFTNALFNGIITGFNGTLRPTLSYAYNISRTYTTQPNIKTDGIYSSFSPYWIYSGGNNWVKNSPTTNWVAMNNNKYYSPYGYLVQSENAIGVPQSQRYVFNHTLPSFQASNAPVDEAGFESFEEYDSGSGIYGTLTNISVTNTTNIYNNDYLGFYAQVSPGGGPSFSGSTAHTGRNCMLFNTTNTVTLTHNLQKTNFINADYQFACLSDAMDMSKLNLKPSLTANVGKKYLVSMWVKGSSLALNYSNLANFSVTANYTNSLSVSSASALATTLTNPNSPIINGWQKLDYVFTVPQTPSLLNPTNIQLKIFSTAAGAFYMDDFRIQPFNATMVCNVYDPYQLRLWAQLDDRNYATLMEYDAEGMLVRKKKETERGTFTMTETRKGSVKN